MNLWQDLRRRKIYRLIGIYVVGAWLAIQVASIFFPAWGIPETALRYLIIAAALAFPVALVFGWFFDITADGIVRTSIASDSDEVNLALRRPDYMILSALALIVIAILVGSFENVREAIDAPVADASSTDKPANSIAVLPFLNMDDDADTEYFSDGVTEEILHRLSSLRSLRVMGRDSSFAFRNSDIGLPRLSDILQVRYLLQGSVRRDRDQVRVTATLVDESGYQIWSETFDKKLEGIFAIQTEIAETVAGQLVKEIGPAPYASARESANIDAYQEYLLGRDYLNKRTSNWQEHAKNAFRKSIELDSQFALPYADLAVTTIIGSQLSKLSDRLAETQGYVDRALELQPDLAEAHAAHGLLLSIGQEANYAASEQALRKALDLDPNLVIAYNWLGTTISSQGRIKEGHAIADQALAIDPLNPVINTNVATRYASSGDFQRAEKLLLRLLSLPEPPMMAYWGLEGLNFSYGRLDRALDWMKQIIRANGPGNIQNHFGALGIAYEFLGMQEESDYWYGKLTDGNPNELSVFFRKAYIMKLRGEYQKTNELLDATTERLNINYKELPVFAAEILGAMHISVGNYEFGIEIMESAIDVDAAITMSSGGGFGAIDFLHILAYAYRQIGDEDRAIKILEKARSSMDSWYADGFARSPGSQEHIALNYAMLGDTDEALRILESAARLGWRRYYFVLHDQRWQETLALPEFKSLMSWVKADIDRQRERVKANETKEDFRAYVEQLEAPEQM